MKADGVGTEGRRVGTVLGKVFNLSDEYSDES